MAAPTKSDNPVRWGVISTANIGAGRVLPAIAASANGRLVGVGSRDLARAERLAARYSGARAYGSYEELLADTEIEAVYIPLPNQLHAEWTIRAAQAGKHVLCEKPLAGSSEDVRRMIAACRDAGVLLMEAFMYRFHPQIRWMLDQIANGAIGAVRNVRCAFTFDISLRPGDVRLVAALAGGSLMDVGCYPLNFSRAVYGHAPQGAVARVIVPAGSEVERTTAALLDFGDDRLAVIDGSFDQPEHQFAEIVGERGRIVLPRPFTPFLTEPVVRIERDDEVLEHRLPAVDQYRVMVEHVAECIRTGAQPMLTPEDALEQAESIELIYRAGGYQRPW